MESCTLELSALLMDTSVVSLNLVHILPDVLWRDIKQKAEILRPRQRQFSQEMERGGGVRVTGCGGELAPGPSPTGTNCQVLLSRRIKCVCSAFALWFTEDKTA